MLSWDINMTSTAGTELSFDFFPVALIDFFFHFLSGEWKPLWFCEAEGDAAACEHGGSPRADTRSALWALPSLQAGRDGLQGHRPGQPVVQVKLGKAVMLCIWATYFSWTAKKNNTAALLWCSLPCWQSTLLVNSTFKAMFIWLSVKTHNVLWHTIRVSPNLYIYILSDTQSHTVLPQTELPWYMTASLSSIFKHEAFLNVMRKMGKDVC